MRPTGNDETAERIRLNGFGIFSPLLNPGRAKRVDGSARTSLNRSYCRRSSPSFFTMVASPPFD